MNLQVFVSLCVQGTWRECVRAFSALWIPGAVIIAIVRLSITAVHQAYLLFRKHLVRLLSKVRLLSFICDGCISRVDTRSNLKRTNMTKDSTNRHEGVSENRGP